MFRERSHVNCPHHRRRREIANQQPASGRGPPARAPAGAEDIGPPRGYSGGRRAALGMRGLVMKMKAVFTVEFEAEDDANAKYFLERALDRASMGLKDSIEQGTPGAAAGTGIRQNST